MYVKRDQAGRISAVSKQALEGFEAIAADSPELVAFLMQLRPEVEQSLAESDLQMARVLEDVVGLLIDKSIIRFTDLPDAAQDKLLQRREMRGSFQAVSLLGDDDELNL